MTIAGRPLTIGFTMPLTRVMTWRGGGRLCAPCRTDPEKASALQPAGEQAGCQIYLALSLTSGWGHSSSNIVSWASKTRQLRPGGELFSAQVAQQEAGPQLLRVWPAAHQQQVGPAIAVEVRRQRLHRGITAAEPDFARHLPECAVALIMKQPGRSASRRSIRLQQPACHLLQGRLRAHQEVGSPVAIVVKENGAISP